MFRHLPKLAVFATLAVLALPGNEAQRDLVLQGVSQAFTKAYHYCDTEPTKCQRLRELAIEAQRVAVTPPPAAHPAVYSLDEIDTSKATWRFEQNTTVSQSNWLAGPTH
ncbi:MAG: hypothetical protein RIC14_08770 [Filomicrobium sp.]